MNNLSWFIYATQIVDNLRALAGGFVFVGLMAGGMSGFVCAMCYWHEDNSAPLDVWRRQMRWLVPSLIFCAFLLVATPSRQTMLLIAGSEMGERAVNSDAVTSIVNPGMDLVKLWIKQETDNLKKKVE